MAHPVTPELFERHPDNPLLSAAMWPYPVNTVFNAAAARMPATGETVVLCRVEDRESISHLCAARSADGVSNWTIDPSPTLPAAPETHPEEKWGIEDPRAVWIEELQQFAVTYTCYSTRGPGVSLALTPDFRSFERIGNILPPENKDAALLPRKIDGRFAIVHRPVPYSVSGANVWMSFSPDLRHWGDHRPILEARGGPYWDGGKIGMSPPLIDTPAGWLMIYHGARGTVSSTNYYCGLALFDRDDPTRLRKRARPWFLGPVAAYERSGDVDNVVFPCGWTIASDGDTLNLYYGAADTSIGLARSSITRMLKWLDDNTT